MATLSKYDKDLKRDIVVKTNVPSEINQLKHEGFKVDEPKTSSGASGKQDSKTKK